MMNAVYYLTATVLLALAELAYFAIARKYGILDHPNNRSMHQRPTIRGGGIVFYLAALLYFLFTFQPSVYFIISLTMISSVGLIDDIKSLSNRLRFAIQSAAFFLLFYSLGMHDLPFWWIGIIFIIATGTINAYNFMDGINGITGGYSTVVLGSLWFINRFYFSFIDEKFILVIVLSLIIFNYFNFRKKAVCFAGDAGSLSIGFIVIFLLLKLMLQTHNYIFIFLLAIYASDSILTIIHRLWLRENIFKPHKLHFFQVMVSRTAVSHLEMTTIYMLAQTGIAAIIIFNLTEPLQTQYYAGIGIAVVLISIYILGKQRLLKK